MSKIIRYLEIIISAVGLSGILYAVGFLSERAHLRMLGLMDLPTANQKYLETGGYFFMKSITSLSAVFIIILDFVMNNWLLLLPLFIVISVLLIVLNKSRFKKTWILNFYKKREDLYTFFSIIIIYILIFILIFRVSFPLFIAAPSISRLPFEDSLYSRDVTPLTSELINFIIHTEERNLLEYYVQLESLFLLLIVLVLFIRKFGSKLSHLQKYYRITRFLYYFLLLNVLIHGIFLPLNFGVLLSSNKYPEVIVSFSSNNNSEQFLFLGKDSQSVGLYSTEKNEFVIFQEINISKIVFIGESSIFKKGSEECILVPK